MTDTELTQTYQQTTQEISSSMILITGSTQAEALAEQLQQKGLDCRFMDHTLESSEAKSNFTYKELSPLFAQAAELGVQLVIAALPEENKLSIGVRKNADGPFQLLSVHQLAVVLADIISDQAAENSFVCVKSVILTDMLESMLHKKEHICKAEVNPSANIEEAGLAAMKETEATEALVVTEQGEFWSNNGFPYLVEQLVNLQHALLNTQQTLFDRLLDLYYRYGFYKEKVLTVNLSEARQAAHFKSLMDYFRKTKTADVASYSIKEIIDYKKGKLVNVLTGKQFALTTTPTDMLKVTFTDGTSLMLVPAEGKIFLYLSLSGKLMKKNDYQNLSRTLDQRIIKLVEVVNQIQL